MGGKWRKAKLALGLNLCAYLPRTLDDDDDGERLSDAALLPPSNWENMVSSSHGLRLSKSKSKSSQQTCSICLMKMEQGGGHAIFIAECSHSFHFHCIASNVKYGDRIYPVCRLKWKEIPIWSPGLDPLPSRASMDTVGWSGHDALMDVVDRLPTTHWDENRQHAVPVFRCAEPGVFNDDESLDHLHVIAESKNYTDDTSVTTMKIETYPEVSTTPRSRTYDDFTVLVHLKAAAAIATRNPSPSIHYASLLQSRNHRAPVDLVTVLDISASMSGTKLALLKRAMGFVIQNLGSNDRLSVIAFSSTARRLFPLRRMSDLGRQQALQAVNSLVAHGGTNIAEGLRKGEKVMEDRTEKNPVTSIILLSDGQDTYTVYGTGMNKSQQNYELLVPPSMHSGDNTGFHIPVHAFGFGADHDASLMHSISDISGGTFSFIETEIMIQDAFAQCIGGLLSVVVQELQVCVECMNPSLCLGSLKAGSYPSNLSADGKTGYIDVGDLYADEERDFLVSVKVPAESAACETSLLKVKCVYRDLLTKGMTTSESDIIWIQRPEIAEHEEISIEVDRQRNRFRAAEAIAEARTAAEQGDLIGAVSILENCRRVSSDTVSAKSHDRLCVALDAELKEMEERMASRHVYEVSGRAYILSGLSSHLWQRATARGDSTDGSSLVQAYQTPSMVEMLTQSQAMLLNSPSTQNLFQPLWSSQPKPR
ncbi:E3 ubiquitin-protein ligase WAV3-like isoform X2 [Hibiscus syriacus]|uniref:E3 ubiquitin-protein ligase WAV3-like isoform X2 n=1 Tax=Hibiscus syriacus TaxID=106335 RepID=UPI001922FAFC|nr:E3 ubiquitin-protein ligase WAV3-like isoform X2 [Hibiscus syriacus]